MTEEKKSTSKNFCICSVCKAKKLCTSKVYAKRIEKFGSEEELVKKYKCLKCRKKEK